MDPLEDCGHEMSCSLIAFLAVHNLTVEYEGRCFKRSLSGVAPHSSVVIHNFIVFCYATRRHNSLQQRAAVDLGKHVYSQCSYTTHPGVYGVGRTRRRLAKVVF